MSDYREKLANLKTDKRHRFRGVYKYSGYKNSGWSGANGPIYLPTFMIVNVEVLDKEKDEWIPVTDHLWMNYSTYFKRYYPMEQGDVIFFDGRITEYRYRGGVNVRIERPTKVIVERSGEKLEEHKDDILEDFVLVDKFMKENEKYYKARDFFADLYKIPRFFFSMEHYGGVDVELFLDDSWVKKADFYKENVDREDIMAIYDRNKTSTKKRMLVSDGEGKREITEKEINKAYKKENRYRYDEEDFFDDDIDIEDLFD